MAFLNSVEAFAEGDADRNDLRDGRRVERGPWLTSNQAAVYCGFSGAHRLRSLYRLVKEFGIVPGHAGKRQLRFRREELDQAIRPRGTGKAVR